MDPCPACGSSDHDGWTNHDDCPEDWSVIQRDRFEHRRWLQLTNERVLSEAEHKTRIGFMVVARYDSPLIEGEVRYGAASGIWPTLKPVENHRAWCEGSAAEKGEPDVQFLICELRGVSRG